MLQATEGVNVGHSYYAIAIDQQAAQEYETRANKWLEIAKRAVSESGVAWTRDRAAEVAHILSTELLVDWEELVALLRAKNAARGNGRMAELDGAKDRTQAELPHQFELLVLAQDRGRIPIAEQLLAPRYEAVIHARRKARSFLDGPQPDYPNAAKEAVSAVEQLARIVTGKPAATLGDAIKELRAEGRVQAPLLKGLEELWGWTSDTPGVRHGASSVLIVDAAAARYIVAQGDACIGLLLSVDAA